MQGRTNKLVDGCYSFWQGGIFPLMHRLLQEEGEIDRRPIGLWLILYPFPCNLLLWL